MRRGVFGNTMVVADSIRRDLGAVTGIEEAELVKKLAGCEGVGRKTGMDEGGEGTMRLRKPGVE